MQSGIRNVVVFICHDLGQHLGCYGVPGVRTPRIDAFAESGVRFENSFCTAPQCSPSRAALWTGRFPHANGAIGLAHRPFSNDLKPGERHLAEILNEHGFETHLFGVQHEARSAERCGYRHVHARRAPCEKLAADFGAFVAGRERTDAPLFAQVGTFEPHRPFPHQNTPTLDPSGVHVPPYLPDIPEVREDLAALEASVACADKAFGRVIDAIGSSRIADNTLILLTADHGTGFPRAKMTLYDPGLACPIHESAFSGIIGR